MTELAVTAGRVLVDSADWRSNPYAWRLWVLAAVLGLLLVPGEIGALTVSALADAYLQVTVFVAATLGLVYLLEGVLRFDMGRMLERTSRWQPFIASLLGAMPGCGGAIIVVTQYTRGYASFGSVVAVLTATMGDAAFLLIAREPQTALGVIAVSIVVGTAAGMVVDRVHGRDFLRRAVDNRPQVVRRERPEAAGLAFVASAVRTSWMVLVVPGLLLGILAALQIDADALLAPLAGEGIATKLGAAGALVALTMWAFAGHENSHVISDPRESARGTVWQRIMADTNFVTGWVVMAFLAFELTVHVFGLDLGTLFKGWAFMMPAVAMLIGFIPGCGPQIVVTTLYLAGAVPLSAQLANAISNDGDALFPAIALAPQAAMLATVYTAVPALIVGYGAMLLFGL
ncbi:MAG: hypothetical protein C0606_17920 [Hyphomicrobiales bacterium]|nr:MAG: hypothetical protein C0606_17920 [Hyphomicrobiales bacterium]